MAKLERRLSYIYFFIGFISLIGCMLALIYSDPNAPLSGIVLIPIPILFIANGANIYFSAKKSKRVEAEFEEEYDCDYDYEYIIDEKTGEEMEIIKEIVQ